MNHYRRSKTLPELFWPKVVMRKWLNISPKNKNSDYSADEDEGEDDASDNDSETEDFLPRDKSADDFQTDDHEPLPKFRRRKSETFRAQYINTKELRVSVGTWNVAGKLPPDDLDIEDWLDITEPADIYVIGFQEVIPLNAGNIFGAEDNRPLQKWENIIRETLNKVRPVKTKFKCFSDPPSPSRFKPGDDAPDIEDEVLLETDSEDEEEIYLLNDESFCLDEVRDVLVGQNITMKAEALISGDDNNLGMPAVQELEGQFSSPKHLVRLNYLKPEDSKGNAEASTPLTKGKLIKILSGTDRMGLSWPEPPLNLLAQFALDRPHAFKPMKSFKASKSFKVYNSSKSMAGDIRVHSEAALLAELDLDSVLYRKRRSPYVRIVSKQMVGVFLTVWVHRSFRRHIQNLNVSTVGVGVMGYIGNKGSISVSMSIYQTLFCFICSHLTSGEKEGDAIKRNAVVNEIHRRTRFNPFSDHGLPKSIDDHERIIWLGDLNYRMNLSYEKTCELISKKDWSTLIECDQLVRELRRGRSFDGWSEGAINFPPTYKYEINSDKYRGEDPKAGTGRRTPAWCDRILSFGKGIKQVSYRRAEIKFSDHRPVSATYLVEVEVLSTRKLQRALTLANAEIEDDVIVADMTIDGGLNRLIIHPLHPKCMNTIEYRYPNVD